MITTIFYFTLNWANTKGNVCVFKDEGCTVAKCNSKKWRGINAVSNANLNIEYVVRHIFLKDC